MDASSSAITTSNTNSLSWSHTVSSGSNRLLIVSVSIRANEPVTSVSYGGNPMSAWTQVAGLTETANKVRGEVWYMKAPPVGTANVVVTLGSNKTFVAGATSFLNVDQTTPLGAAVSNQGSGGDPNNTSPSLPISSAVGELAFDFVAVSRGTSSPTPPTTGSGQSILWSDHNGILSSDGFGASSTKPGSPSVSMTWNVDVVAGAGEWVWIGTAIKPAPVNLPPTATDRALLFDGTDLVVIPPQPGLVMNTTMTMEALVQRTGTPTGTEIIVNKEGEYELGITSTGVLQWAFANTTPGWNWISTGIQLPPDKWVHVAVTYNAGVIRSYVNGTLVDQVNGTGGLGDVYPAMNDLTIGGRQNATTQRWSGWIDEVRVWNVERSPAQVLATYNTALTGAEAGLMGYWRFNEPTGLTALDGTANGYQGTLGNGTAADVPARALSFTTIEETLVNVPAPGALSYATDPEGGPLTAILVSPPSNAASFTLNANGSFSYTPAVDFSGTDSFVFMALDGAVNSAPATVYLFVTPVTDIKGRVFEDVNYGGGAGRDRTTALSAGGTGRPNARVELYDASGNFISSTLTNASGDYRFSNMTPGTRTIRVVNSTVSSSRAGFVANTHLAVQTFRSDAPSGTAIPISDHVGGEVPGKADAGNGSTTLIALTTAANTPQSISSVTNGIDDVVNVDFGYSYNVVVNKNDAGQGSLRQLMTNMNALSDAGLAIQGRTAGIDHGVFMLADGVARPGLTVTYATMFASGAATIVPLTPLPSISTPMVLDASTHPLFSGAPIIELNGSSAGAGTDGLTLAAGSTGSTIKGFVINRFQGDGIQVSAGGSFIQGNYIGVNVAGTAASANTLTGVNINNVGTTTVGGTAAGQGNTIAGNGGAEVQINGLSASSNTVQGNMIGVRFNGTTVIASAGSGILISGGGDGNVIGGTAAGAGNIIGGNALAGVEIKDAGTTSTIVQGNYIGTNASDADLGNTQQGVKLSSGTTANLIGGTVTGSGNTIAWNDMQGISSNTNADAGNRYWGNSIHDNALLGIDLGNDGVTYNDPGDGDSGPNAKQNFPKLTGANTVGGNTTITGTFNSTASTTYRIEYFSSPIGDPTGYGEGTTFLGTNNITTNASGNATINVTFPVTVPSGHAVCATATNLTTNNTSEFSAFAAAPTDSDIDGVTDDIDIDDDNDGIPDDIEDLGFDSRGGTIACTQPAMNFQNPVLVSGTANTPGAVYRFTNVLPGIDARLTITAMSNASLVTVDDPGLGTPDSWQPVIDFTGIGTPGIDFNMAFVLTGTTTPAASITRFGGTTYDVDGVGEVESFLFTSPSVYAVDQPTLLVYQTLPGGQVDISGDGTTDGAGISADPRYRAYFQYKNTNQFNFRCQYKRTTTGTTQRYLSLRFNECFLIDLVNVQLYIVDGLDTDGDGVPDYLDVDSDNDGIYDVVEAGSGQPQTNGVLNGGVTTSGLKVAVDANLNNAIDYTLRDSDGDNIYDGVELDSDNDGCRDVWEAGFTDNNADGRLGNSPLIVNNSGKVTSGTDGYTTPADQNGNSVFDYREVFAMSMTCPANMSVPAGAGVCTAAVTVPAPTVIGACGGYTLTNSFNGTANASGTYPRGTTSVTFTATDNLGNTAFCTMTVTVNDTQNPSISCPANIVVNNDPGVCGAVVTYTAPVGTDNCTGATTARIAGPASGSVFPIGTTTVTHRVTDGSGNTAQCSFTVTVNDTQNPSITCPANISVGSGPGICGAVVNYVAPVGTDNCAGVTTARIAGPASGSTFPPGTTTVTYQVTDALGNTAQCSFTVTVAPTDNDADGVCDNVDLDDDNDGIPDTAEGGAALDTDGDGVPNRFDLDSDNDGIYDCVESGSAQAFTAGVLNGAVTANGIPVSVDANANNVVDYAIRDSDGDGTIDSLELDADSDGCNDVIEAGYTDANSDGRLGPAPLTVDASGLVTSGNN